MEGILSRAAFSDEDMADQSKAFRLVKEIADQYVRGMQTYRTRHRIEIDPAFARRHRALGMVVVVVVMMMVVVIMVVVVVVVMMMVW